MSRRIRGITIEIDGDTKGLDKALSDVTKESNKIQTELRDVNRLLRFNPKNTELLAQKKQLLAKQVETTRERLTRLKGAQEQVNEAFQKGEISEKQYRDFQREIVETESKLKHYENQLKQVDKTHRSFGERLASSGKTVKDFGDKMTSVGKELSKKVTAPLTAVAGIATKIGMDFKAGLSEVQALSGATADELEQLEIRSRELGSSTKFSAKEVTEGFKYMALAGWDVKQSLDGIDGVLALSAASGEDLARVSDILTDAISAFGDEAKDASRYADVLAAASSNANTDVAGLGESFKMVAPVAGALNYSLEDTAVALGLMANAGIKGSAAGTSLRSALTNLVKPTAAMQKQMKKLGIEVTDSEGQMKPLNVLLGDLRESFSTLSEDQKASAAATIFGKEAMSGMLAVINASEGDFDKLTKAIANSEGVAQEMADTMQNNLQGKLTNLKSALEELAIKLFDALEPALTAIVGSIQEFVDWLNDLDEKTQRIIVIVGSLVAALGPLLVILGPLLSALGSFMMILPTLGPLLATLTGPIGLITAGLVALGGAYMLTRERADESVRSQKKLAEQNLELAQSYTEVLEEKHEQLDATAELLNKTKEQVAITDELVDTYEELANKSKLTTDEFGEFLTLQTELGFTKSPQKIKEIEERMEELRKKSGLSKDEFNKLVESNQKLAEVFPEAGQAVDDYGNIIMDTTGKLREMTRAELERMQIEVYNKMIEDLDSVNQELRTYEDLLGSIIEVEDEIRDIKDQQIKAQEEIKANEAEREANLERIAELREKQKDATIAEKYEYGEQIKKLIEKNRELHAQDRRLNKNLKTLEETLGIEEETLKEKQNQREQIEQLIDKNTQNYDGYVKILEMQHDINIEKGNENKSLDEAIKKRQEEIKQLEEKIKKEGDSNDEHKETINHLKTEIKQLEEAQTNLSSINRSLDYQNEKYTSGEKTLYKVNQEFDKSKKKTDENIRKADIWNKHLGKPQKKNVTINQNKNPEEENKKWGQRIRKTIDVVTTGLSKLKFWAEGTNYHPGGPAVLGEEGPELVEHRGRMSLASFGMYDLPTGAKVYTADETIAMLQGGLASGISQGLSLQNVSNTKSDNADVINLLKTQNDLLMMLLDKDSSVYLDRHKVGKLLTDPITSRQKLNEDVLNKFRG